MIEGIVSFLTSQSTLGDTLNSPFIESLKEILSKILSEDSGFDEEFMDDLQFKILEMLNADSLRQLTVDQITSEIDLKKEEVLSYIAEQNNA